MTESDPLLDKTSTGALLFPAGDNGELERPLLAEADAAQQQEDSAEEEARGAAEALDDSPDGGEPQASSSHAQEAAEEAAAASPLSPSRCSFERISLIILTSVVWSSGFLFGLYMWGHYLLGPLDKWNVALPHLYSGSKPVATFGIGLHFFGGSITIMLGAVQLIGSIRKRWPAVHRWLGRVYVTCASLTAVGGLLFIVRQGCIGGRLMDVAFSCCAFLTLLSAAQTYRCAAVSKDYERHQLWAWRLYSLMIASWMYRLEYTAAMIFRIPHDPEHYSYALDDVMDFFFYVPNLILVEILWRTRHSEKPKWLSNALGALFLLVAMAVLFFSTLEAYGMWIPGMMGQLDYDDDDGADDGL